MASDEDDDGCGTTTSSHSVSHSSARKGRQKRGVLPKQATNIMRAWLFQHLVVSVFYFLTKKKGDENKIFIFLF